MVVATGTASGKSLCYQLPVFEALLGGGRRTALYLSPTKALAHDQLRAIRSFALTGVRAASYDGDTPTEERPMVRRTANLVQTNPDMLHQGILPSHERWSGFFGRLADVMHDSKARQLQNVYYLQGFSGHGLALTGLAGKLVAEAIDGNASRFDTFARIRHRPFPGGRLLRTPALVAGMAYYRLKDLL